ncbi:MAG: hypothetical protein R3304_10725 [Longimicrobiales bacterium]|nr:hypothetical protein [Longimicrobiales bacterium]
MSGGRSIRALRVFWTLMIVTTLVYTGVVYGMMATGSVDVAAFDSSIMNVVGASVMVLLVGALVVRRRMLAVIPQDATPEERISRYGRLSVIAMAIMESGGILVITFAMLSGSPTWVLAGGGAAAILMLMAKPSREELDA